MPIIWNARKVQKGKFESYFADFSFSTFGITFYDSPEAFNDRLLHGNVPPDSPRKGEQGEFEDINLGTNSLACIWSTRSRPSWIFVDMGISIYGTEYSNVKNFVVLRPGEDIGRILTILDDLGYENKQVESLEIEHSLIQKLKEKISGCEVNVTLPFKEFNLATYTVMRQLIDEIISYYDYETDEGQEPLKVSEEICSALATYIAELAAGLQQPVIEEFEKILVSVMRQPGMISLLDISFFQKCRGIFSTTAPSSFPLSKRSRSQSFSFDNSPMYGRRLVSLPNSPRACCLALKTPLQVSHEEKLTKKEGASSPSPIKSGQGSCPPSPSRTKSRGIAVDSPSIWQRLKQRSKRIYEKWKALSLGYKIMAVMAFAIGVSAIVYGCVFCSPVVVLIPLVGSLNASAIAVIGGTIVAGIASVVHAFHVSFTKANSSNVGGEENFAVSSYMKRVEIPSVESSLAVPGSQSVPKWEPPVESPLAAPGSQSVLADLCRQCAWATGVLKIAPPPVPSTPLAAAAAGASITKSSSGFFLHRRGSPVLCDSPLVVCGSPGDMTVHIGQLHRRGSQSFSGSGTPPASRNVLEGVPCAPITLLKL